jgi:hypothetical protein
MARKRRPFFIAVASAERAVTFYFVDNESVRGCPNRCQDADGILQFICRANLRKARRKPQ